MMGPQLSAVATGMREETDVSNTEEIVLVVSSWSLGPDVKVL